MTQVVLVGWSVPKDFCMLSTMRWWTETISMNVLILYLVPIDARSLFLRPLMLWTRDGMKFAFVLELAVSRIHSLCTSKGQLNSKLYYLVINVFLVSLLRTTSNFSSFSWSSRGVSSLPIKGQQTPSPLSIHTVILREVSLPKTIVS